MLYILSLKISFDQKVIAKKTYESKIKNLLTLANSAQLSYDPNHILISGSQPEMEYQETLNKARGLLKAVEITAKRAPSQTS